MFLGQYSYRLDSKGRVTIPARFREKLVGSVVITRGLDRCLTVYPIHVWNTIAKKVDALPITDPKARALRRIFFSDAENVEVDRQGRIRVPERLREYAEFELSTEIKIVGLNQFVELWNGSHWEAENEKQMELESDDPTLWENLQI
jgi:MraZ protein